MQLGEARPEAKIRFANLSDTSSRVTTSQTAKSGAKVVTSSHETSIPDTSIQRTTASTRTASTTPVTAAASHSNPSNNVVVKIGAGVGIPLGVALFGALVYIIYLQHKQSRNKVNHPAKGTSAEEENKDLSSQLLYPQANKYQGVGYQQPELSAERERFELCGSDRPQALESAVELSAQP